MGSPGARSMVVAMVEVGRVRVLVGDGRVLVPVSCASRRREHAGRVGVVVVTVAVAVEVNVGERRVLVPVRVRLPEHEGERGRQQRRRSELRGCQRLAEPASPRARPRRTARSRRRSWARDAPSPCAAEIESADAHAVAQRADREGRRDGRGRRRARGGEEPERQVAAAGDERPSRRCWSSPARRRGAPSSGCRAPSRRTPPRRGRPLAIPRRPGPRPAATARRRRRGRRARRGGRRDRGTAARRAARSPRARGSARATTEAAGAARRPEQQEQRSEHAADAHRAREAQPVPAVPRQGAGRRRGAGPRAPRPAPRRDRAGPRAGAASAR